MLTFWKSALSAVLPTRMVLPLCSTGGCAWICATRAAGVSTLDHENPVRMWPTTWTLWPEPVRIWMLPAPVRTLRSTGPLTASVRSKVPSAGTCAFTTSQPPAATRAAPNTAEASQLDMVIFKPPGCYTEKTGAVFRPSWEGWCEETGRRVEGHHDLFGARNPQLPFRRRFDLNGKRMMRD